MAGNLLRVARRANGAKVLTGGEDRGNNVVSPAVFAGDPDNLRWLTVQEGGRDYPI